MNQSRAPAEVSKCSFICTHATNAALPPILHRPVRSGAFKRGPHAKTRMFETWACRRPARYTALDAWYRWC